MMNNTTTRRYWTPAEQELYFGVRDAVNSACADAACMMMDNTIAEFLVETYRALHKAIQERDDRYSNATRQIIAAELANAASLHPDNAAWTQDLAQAARIAEIGLGAYVVETGHAGKPLTETVPYPMPDYGSVWAELRGYVEEAASERDGEKSGDGFPCELLAYMDELKAKAMEPGKNWLREISGRYESPSNGE